MLRRGDGSSFTSSRCVYLDALPRGGAASSEAKVFVRLSIGIPRIKITAMLDTGAAFSVLHTDLAEELGAFDETDAPTLDLGTRHGRLNGRLVRRPIQLIADEGSSLEVDATFWVSPAWRFGHFLGYNGLLQRIRFALDPEANQFHFGPI